MAIQKKGPTLLDILIPPIRCTSEPPPEMSSYKYVYYAGGGTFKGTNDEVLGWNHNRPAWVGFLNEKNKTRWYVYKGDLTPTSLARALEEIARKEAEKAKRMQEARETSSQRLQKREESRKKRGIESVLDGREEEILALQSKHSNVYVLSKALCTSRATLKRKLKMMGEK